MIASILLSLAPSPAPVPLLAPSPASAPVAEAARLDDYKQQIEDAGEDVEKLLVLARAWKEDGKTKEAKAAFTRVVELDDANQEAHEGLRHHFYDGQWFKSYSALSKYRRAEAKKKEAEGYSRLGDEWVKTEDLPYLRLGWVKGDDGAWCNPRVVAQAELEKKMLAEGRQFRMEDSSWVHPDDFEKWRQKQYKCGDKWVSQAEAEAFHAEMNTPWIARGEKFEVMTTCKVDTLAWACWHADKTWDDLVRIYGMEPGFRPPLVVFKDIAQYNFFAAGDESTRPNEASGFSSLHYAYFADAWFDGTSEPPQYLGTGVGYWDVNDPNLEPFGKHSVRHAAGLAYIQALAPSLGTIGEAIGAGAMPELEVFWAEKRVPLWMVYGAASYVERYYQDPDAADPWWTRNWAIANIETQGGLDKLDDVFEFGLSLDDIPGSTKLISEAGLVVAFILDGECQAVTEKHEEFKAVLKSGEDTTKAAEALQKAVKKNLKALKKFAGI